MEEIKNLFIKHFGFYPDIISTTEHAYISPPSRIISSLIELFKFSNKKILRLVITDTFSVHAENSTKQVCIPYLLNKNIFSIDINSSKEELIKKFEEDSKKIGNILKDKLIFSLQEKINYIDVIILYRNVLKNIRSVNSVVIYNNIIKMYANNLQLNSLYKCLENTDLFGVNSLKIRIFLKEAFDILNKSNSREVNLFGKYLETKKRLKLKSDNFIQTINWENYLKELYNVSNLYSVPFEIILYIYSYYGGSHFGNDYGMVSDINKIRDNNNLFQMTEKNKDYSFSIEKNNIQFQNISFFRNNCNLSQKIYKKVNTLSELYILLGKDDLINKFRNQLKYML